jgi:CHAT domain-containing protein/tetratricopeptide (TPR) repeat protein
VRILHLDLKLVADNSVELRYFFDNPNQYERRSLSLQDISDPIEIAEQGYYFLLEWQSLRSNLSPEDYAKVGKKLHEWLDGSDRWLVQQINQYPGEGIVLAISASEGLAHLPWEVLHDGNCFLVERSPAIFPVRWAKPDIVKSLTVAAEPENRALQVLFMATSPLNMEPVLDFEAEEGRILEATARQPLSLIVEESGCLSELGYLVSVYGKGYFDVLHLTGHATFSNGEPRFITETETGEAYLASAVDIAKELQFQFPKLIFLSGCRTGQAGQSGAVPSIAEELLKSGAKAVLGWGQTVLDTEATMAATTLYQAVSAGKSIAEAVALTYQALIQHKARDWHLLRLYVANTLPGELVTPLRTRGRKLAPPPSVATQFLDPATQTVKVPTRESFVGRRRQLQNCLRALNQPTDQIGVLIYGMGGLGKSSLAARLCDRFSPEFFERVIWIGRIDQPNLVKNLANELDSPELRRSLENPNEELKFRLRRAFRQHLAEEAARPFLLVLDDFDVNLEARGEGYIPQPEAATILEALVWAIRELSAPHRLILTSRYDFEFTQLQYFDKQPLDAFRGADLRKKCDRVFNSQSQVSETLQVQVLRLADGNLGLLEYLSNEILQNSTTDPTETLNYLETNPTNLRKQVLADSLLDQINQSMQEVLQRALIFELPVPREAITAICETISDSKESINRVISLGLLEVSSDGLLRVPRILPLQPPKNLEVWCRKGAETLYHIYLKDEKTTEEKLLEVHRLSLLGKAEKTAVIITKFLTKRWFYRGKFREAFRVCHNTLTVTEDFDILNRLAYAEVQLGGIHRARERYQQVLKKCPDVRERAAIYCNQADLEAKLGNFKEALNLYQQALEIDKRNNDKGAMATTLATIGLLKVDLALTGMLMAETASMEILRVYIREASFLSKEAQALVESIDDLERRASTLHLLGRPG